MESDTPHKISFKQTFAWVVAAHVILIIGISLWSWVVPTAPPPLKFISMVNAGDLVRGLPGSSTGPVVGPKPTPAMEQPSPQPTPVVKPPALAPQELTYQQPAKPDPTPTDIAPQLPEPSLLPVKPVVKQTPKPRPRVKVDLQEVMRNDAPNETSAAAPSHHASRTPRLLADASDTTLSSLAVAEKLGRSLQASGVTGAVVTGKSGRSDGADSEAGRYYTLIRDQMYDAWERPLNLLGKGFCTEVHIFIEKNGAISTVQLKQSSGNSQHDESALSAVRKVGKIAEPLPDGVDGGVDINFKLTN